MSKVLALCVALIIGASVIVRAEDYKPVTNAGAHNLMFTFGGLASMAANPFLTVPAGNANNPILNVFGGGYRYFLANELALRGTLGLVMNSSTTKASNTGWTDATTSATGFLIGAGIEKHFVTTSEVSAHAGASVTFLTGSAKNIASHDPSQQESSTKNSGTDIGIQLYGGMEWFFTSMMSIGAEYQFGYTSSGSSVTSTSGGKETTTDGPSQTAIGTSCVNAILNVFLGR